MRRLWIAILIILVSCEESKEEQEKSLNHDNKEVVADQDTIIEKPPAAIGNSYIKRDVSDDTLFVTGSTDHFNVALFYSSYLNMGDTMITHTDSENPIHRISQLLFYDFDAILSDDSLSFLLAKTIQVFHDSIVILNKRQYWTDNDTLQSYQISKMHGVSSVVKLKSNLNLSWKEPLLQSSSSYENEITFKHDSYSITLSDLLNVKIYEADLNLDGNLEIYVFSFLPSSSQYRIYQIGN